MCFFGLETSPDFHVGCFLCKVALFVMFLFRAGLLLRCALWHIMRHGSQSGSLRLIDSISAQHGNFVLGKRRGNILLALNASIESSDSTDGR